MLRRSFARILVSLSILLVILHAVGYFLTEQVRHQEHFDAASARRLVDQALTASALKQMDPGHRLPVWSELSELDLRFADAAPVIDVSPEGPDASVVASALTRVLVGHQRFRLEYDEGLHVWLAVGQAPGTWVRQRVDLGGSNHQTKAPLIVLGVLVLSLLGAYGLARQLAAPVERLAAQADDLVRGRADTDVLKGAPTEIRELANALTQAGASRSNALRERELILAGLSHDLRTPLSRIRLALELGDAHTDEGRGAMAADIEEIDAIVRQFIDYVRSGREEAPKEVALAPLLQEVVHANGGNLKNWTIHIHEPAVIVATPLALQRALANLVVNARRHAAPPYTANLVCPDPGHVAITITDEGTGIPLDLHRRIGEPFLAREGRARVGSGLGLAIVSRIVRRHGGRLELIARQPRGTMARIILPIQPAPLKLEDL
ncbi:hypothetical protein C7S18_19440 [Ahniella affigens]|uniref:histidine kinase n=1 Tax=Ahniella affigens TaxID=2021234 RepID=A0A2P1PWJ5_9GAMM|nr:ATP-binding protein [Ahniella affigens]AVP99202.1 hypothetical protein C7S18_19440 [Ahniella affigens]